MTFGAPVRVWAPYKVSLAGEHAVGYGGSSIVAALDVGLTLTVHPPARTGEGSFRCGRRISRWRRGDVEAFAEAVDRRFDHVGAAAWRRWRRDWFAPSRYVAGSWVRRAGLGEIDAASPHDVWPGAGLGTSSAAAAALSLACAELAGRAWTAAELAAEIRLADRLRHGGIPSGVDGAVVTAGGLLSFGAGVIQESFAAPEIELVLVHSRVERDCNEVIARLAARGPRRLVALVAEMEELTARVAGALRRADSGGLYEALEEHYPLMRRHGLGDAQVTALIAALRRQGARAAKLTGAGAGGVVVAFCPPGAAAGVLRYCAAHRLRALATAVGAGGCTVAVDQGDHTRRRETAGWKTMGRTVRRGGIADEPDLRCG